MNSASATPTPASNCLGRRGRQKTRVGMANLPVCRQFVHQAQSYDGRGILSHLICKCPKVTQRTRARAAEVEAEKPRKKGVKPKKMRNEQAEATGRSGLSLFEAEALFGRTAGRARL
jgi:hypothetical protein